MIRWRTSLVMADSTAGKPDSTSAQNTGDRYCPILLPDTAKVYPVTIDFETDSRESDQD